MVTDPHGRYIMVSRFINCLPLTFLNNYGPNTDDPNFYKKVFDLLSDGNNTNIVIGGGLELLLRPLFRQIIHTPPTWNCISTGLKQFTQVQKSGGYLENSTSC